MTWRRIVCRLAGHDWSAIYRTGGNGHSLQRCLRCGAYKHVWRWQ